MANYDVLITGAQVVDGTGNPWFYGDVALKGDRIAAITRPGEIKHAQSAQVVDATDMVVSPGFIDILSHSIVPLMVDARCVSKIAQGVTTEIMGEDGTPAPYGGREDQAGFTRSVMLQLAPEWKEAIPTWTHFRDWLEAMVEREPRLTVGWAAKILNVYLKTRVYIGGQGRHHLKEMIHPPIDAGLWLGLKRKFPGRTDILDRTHCVSRIKDIADYDCYGRIIDGCRAAASALGCELIEVEQLWAGTEFA